VVAVIVVVVVVDDDVDTAAAAANDDDDGAEEEDDDANDAADDDIVECEVAVAVTGIGITGFSFEALRDDVKASVCSRRMPSDTYHINSHILSLIVSKQRQPTFRHVLFFPNVL
jgi:hypothetical protein